MYCFYQKLINTAIRIFHLFWFLPKRAGRVAAHLQTGIENISKLTSPRDAGFWSLELLILILDTAGIAEVYETAADFLKWNSRIADPRERQIMREVFGGSLQENRILLDQRAFLGPQQRPLVYVSFFTVNSWGKFSDDTFVHELVHVWQYQKHGAVYILRALRAQKSRRGYDYGGVEMLKKMKARNKNLEVFNFEQRAEIVQDYFRLKNNLPPKRGAATAADLPVYEWFARSVRK